MKQLSDTGTLSGQRPGQGQKHAGAFRRRLLRRRADAKAVIGKHVSESTTTCIDTHTAVAFDVLEQYRQRDGRPDHRSWSSTASPFKFCASVLDALGVDGEARPGTELAGRS